MYVESTGRNPQNGSTFFSNTDCAYFPCHSGVDEHEFNCLFCYCPLYALGPRCGGNYRYTEAGIKDCAACTRLHVGDAGAALVKEHFAELAELARVGEGEAREGLGERDVDLGGMREEGRQ